MAKALPQLPADYYLQHFNELIRHLLAYYQPVFTPELHQLTQTFACLPLVSQKLWVRLLNRKGPVFALSDIQYPEVPDQAAALAGLQQAGFVTPLASAEDCQLWLERATKPELVQLLEALPLLQQARLDADQLSRTADKITQTTKTTNEWSIEKPWKKTASRAQLLQHVAAYGEILPSWLQAITPSVVLRQQDSLRYGYFLYFGRLEQNLTAFTRRDLGLAESGPAKTSYSARYLEPELAQQAFFYAQLQQELRQLQQLWPQLSVGAQQQALANWQCQIEQWPAPLDERNQLILEWLCEKLGRLAEKHGDTLLAIQCYRHCRAYPASERLVRLYDAKRQQPEYQALFVQLLTQMQQDPCCDDEYWFARDFAQRKLGGHSRSDLSQILQQAETIQLDELYLGQTEVGACRYYQQRGWQACYSENQLWLALFGLCFWQELFLSADSAIYNPFEKRPRDLTCGAFYQRQTAAIEAKLQLMLQPAAAIQLVMKNLTQFYPQPNAVFRWHPALAEQLPLLLNTAPSAGVATLLRQMATDFRRYSHGFPDLCVWDHHGQLRFIELKARGDSVRRNQLSKMLTMQQLGFDVQLVKVDWWVDPARSYVVVDVETTGGRPEQDRIIEIAALKVQGGVIVERLCTLLNPDRRVPRFISRLTGITPDMLVQAPRFADIAQQLAEFLADSVFVAHNVNFDFGFVRAELQRCGFQLAPSKLCTVVQMRRCYPKLPSYGLAALCQHFSILLEHHHRAEADATATVALLGLIHQAEQALASRSSSTDDHSCSAQEPEQTSNISVIPVTSA